MNSELFNLNSQKVKEPFGPHYLNLFQWLYLMAKILPVKHYSGGIFADSIIKQLNGLSLRDVLVL